MPSGTYAYLTMTAGPQPGAHYPLDPAVENRVGRGVECGIVLPDSSCSRVHATFRCEEGRWWLRDQHSRNGTFLDGQRVQEAALYDGVHLKFGVIEFAFRESDQPPTLSGEELPGVLQTLIKDTRVGSDSHNLIVDPVRETDQARDVLLLYQLAIKLLRTEDPAQVRQVGLELLRSRTAATHAGLLWLADDGQLRPEQSLPEDAQTDLRLSDSLLRLVCEEGHAVWIANQQSGKGRPTPDHAGDSLCIPLVHQNRVQGALHAHQAQGRFRQSQFDFAISLADILAGALVRSRRAAQTAAELHELRVQQAALDELVGQSEAARSLQRRIAELAGHGECVLIRGEPGAGKRHAALLLVRSSARADRPVCTFNPSAWPPADWPGLLFGGPAHEPGLVAQADTGTLIVEHLETLGSALQAQLLQLLEAQQAQQLPGQPRNLDVRVIATLSHEPGDLLRQGRLRGDLYDELRAHELYVPPLRTRAGDLPLFVHLFLEHFRRIHGRPGLELGAAAERRLLAHHWPGNLRELRNVLDNAVLAAAADEIAPADLGLPATGDLEPETLLLEEWERRLIRVALQRTGGNVPEAARLLGIGRATLYRKLEEYGIERLS